MEAACFSQPLLLRSYISPLFPCLVTSALKMEAACFSQPLFLKSYISPLFASIVTSAPEDGGSIFL
jgi:hypothetical protein